MYLNLKKIVIFNIFATLLIIAYLVTQYARQNSFYPLNALTQNEHAIKDYLENNPQIIITSLENYHKNQIAEQNRKAKEALSTVSHQVFDNKDDPRIGDKNAKIKIVEFFDYSCGYCQKMLSVKNKILENHKDVQIIFKEMPIMTDGSVFKSKVSLAFYQVAPQKYLQFQEELFKVNDNTQDINTYINIITRLAVNEHAFKKAFDEIQKNDTILKENINLAMNLGLQGTPAYIIGDEIIPGYTNYEVFNSKINAQRKAN